jgi:hypothetical protein
MAAPDGFQVEVAHLDLGRQAAPALTGDVFAAAMVRLDALDDTVFAELYRLTPAKIVSMRARFAGWPRG